MKWLRPIGPAIKNSRPIGRPRKPLPKICHRGHNTEQEGFYLQTKRVINKTGKKYFYKTKICRRCRIEDAQRARAKREQALMHKMPSRREGFVERIVHINSAGSEDPVTVTINVDQKSGQVLEVFAANPMVGSDIEAILTDGCILISLCLQAGISLEELIRKLGDRRKAFEEPGPPTSVFGSIVRAAKKIDDELRGEKR